MVSVPVPLMASREFTARFASIWSTWEGSIFTCHSSSPGFQASSMSSPISRRSILSMPATVSLRSSTRGLTVCLRANASSCRVRSADLRAASRICRRNWYSGWAESVFIMAISV